MGEVVEVKLAAVLAEFPDAVVAGAADSTISGVAYRADEVTPGGMFVAIPGHRHDGHDFIPDALAHGARVIVGERAAPADLPAACCYIRVADARLALGQASAAFYDHPSHAMEIIGVTGTDGKTTTSTLIEYLLARAGRRTGLMTTVDFKIGADRQPNNTRFTTLEAPEVQAALRQMHAAATECAIVETTSSGLALHRVAGVEYDLAVLTNITSEHLEVHGTWENYRRAKAMLCEAVDPDRRKPLATPVPTACVLNRDDPNHDYLTQFCRAPVLSYGIERPDAAVWADELDLAADGTTFRLHLPATPPVTVHTPFVGRFNVSNCLAAISVAHLHGLAPDLIVAALAQAPNVYGRMDRVDMGQPFTVVVDYAHTADSLRNVLEVLRPLTRGRLIAVFGSAGDRDRVKRPEMGAVAARLADFAVITDEDPREEDAAAILREIAIGAEHAGARAGKHFVEIVGRRDAIVAAFAMAQPGDTVLLAGKGHEQSIIIGREKLPWDDRGVARDVLQTMGYPSTTQEGA